MHRRLALPLALAVTFVALAGCNTPGADPVAGMQPAPASPGPAPIPAYRFQVVVSEERPDGPKLPAEVHATRLDAQGRLAAPVIRPTDGNGVASFTLFEPGTYLVRVLGPAGWTQEGVRLTLDDAGPHAEGFVVSDGDLFVTLYRSELSFTGSQSWMTTLAQPNPDGSMQPAYTGIPLPMPEGLEADYAARLATAQVTVRWSDSLDGAAASLAAGLVGGDALLAEGQATQPSPVPADREASWSGTLDGTARAAGASLQAAAVTHSAVVGTVLLDFEVLLTLAGQVPPELPPLNCHAAVRACGVLPPLPPLA